jgi:hypothetical protein
VTVPLTIVDPTRPAFQRNILLKPRASRELSGVCEFRMRSLHTLERRENAGPSEEDVHRPPTHSDALNLEKRKQTAFENQEVLDGARRDMEECIRLETSHVGEESNEIDKLKYEIGIEEKERDALQTQYLAYEKSGSNLAAEYRQKFEKARAKIADDQSQIIMDEQDLRERQTHIDLENDFLKEINARLEDPGRIRPALSFDDYFSGLGNHVLAVALLAVGMGLVLDPVNTALMGALFDGPFLWLWSKLRRRRPPVYRIKSGMSTGLRPAPAVKPVDYRRTGLALLMAKTSDYLPGAEQRKAKREKAVRDPLATYSLDDPFMIPVTVRIPVKDSEEGSERNPSGS